MQFIACGGGNEVGASCYLLKSGGRNYLIDAGIRMGGKEEDRLPDLSQLQQHGGIHCVIITHAHLDHIGALPLVHMAFPEAPIYCTPPTRMLMQVLLFDAIKVMTSRWEKEKEVLLYPHEAVTATLSAVKEIPCRQKLFIDDHSTVEFYPAGHILGAAMVQIRTKEGTALFTGDFSLLPQRTVEGALLPRSHPHLLVSESTYGTQLHANRTIEENRLVESVSAVLHRKGKVLVPAFSLGRAQEVLLILKEARRKGFMPDCPLYADGMVKNVCAIYGAFHEYLARPLQKDARRGESLFFNQERNEIAVEGKDRQAIVDGPPCVIVSSSGMLTGGPSVFYAKALAGDERNALFLTGYQDEESPGRRLMELADAKDERRLVLDGESVAVNCSIGKYALSAHADSGQIAALISRLCPADVVLVHGDDNARYSLAKQITGKSAVHVPLNGDSLQMSHKAYRGAEIEQPQPLAPGKPIDRESVETLREHILTGPKPDRLFSLQDLAQLLSGEEREVAALEQLRTVIEREAGLFVKDTKRPFLFRAAARAEGSTRLEMNAAFAAVDRIFRDCHDLYRRGANVDNHQLVLYFNFPLVAKKRFENELKILAVETCWDVTMNPTTNSGVLLEKALRLFPEGVLLKNPSLYTEEQYVKVKVKGGTLDERSKEEKAAHFLELTGYRLVFEEAAISPALPQKTTFIDGRMEQNLTFSLIKEAFRETTVQRTSLKKKTTGEPYLEISFISMQIGERFREKLDKLSKETGWDITINPEPNQHLIKEKARTLIPSSWGVKKEPGFFGKERQVRVKVLVLPPDEEISKISKQFEEETGFELKVVLD
ncbi:MAG: MBL fold metallo-hydrolase [Candidatus Xenobiia bacterium LiM19]